MLRLDEADFCAVSEGSGPSGKEKGEQWSGGGSRVMTTERSRAGVSSLRERGKKSLKY